ncbi:DUF4260 domain-containing protein [Vibrio vulnificus]|uniref:DUF4260 domain-containing protein n=1 Tax=Vibrio vulnificus TaxID=672 RepID=UPI0005F0CD1A|nr:DUF4260 domain-containing protein [Vibrio vulnificus]MBN8089130.1 DUF4260 domain-containing protein [Vibrio vulnificus]MBN8118056.1 DUF4260 domain-containing protein [Vibrio vulnificus]
MCVVKGTVKTILQIEGGCIFIASMFFYSANFDDWITFSALFFFPDIAILGYLISSKVGAIAYNCTHSLIGAGILLLTSIALSFELAKVISIIWFAHIGFDRMLGYGLKYSSNFKDTHLGIIGSKH